MGQNASESKSGPEDASNNQHTPDQASQAEVDRQLITEGSELVAPIETEKNAFEWKFIDFRKTNISPIHAVDPVTLKRFIGHNVTVMSMSREEHHGCCLAIDPVSLSVILAKRVPEGRIRVITLPGYHLATITVSPNSVTEEETVSVNDLDIAELYHAQSLYSEKKPTTTSGNQNNGGNQESTSDPSKVINKLHEKSGSQCKASTSVQVFSNEDIQMRKELLHELLKKHRMPVTVKGDTLEILGGVKISPPYTLESCDTKGNQVIKKKLAEFLSNLE